MVFENVGSDIDNDEEYKTNKMIMEYDDTNGNSFLYIVSDDQLSEGTNT